uniref:Uncharacterized protein n=1 Tax=Timema bartmani TaxID=61472 RepID=A0A7R9F037_9NEOP|nr:unnamed protein product [Timema bartmani]
MNDNKHACAVHVCYLRLKEILTSDTAGQERYRTITTAYYRGAMGFILMYDITNEESFNSVQDWVTQIKTYSWDNAQVILVGNKCDMEDERVISFERGKQLAEQLGIEFFETSAKENINVKVNHTYNTVTESLVCSTETLVCSTEGVQGTIDQGLQVECYQRVPVVHSTMSSGGPRRYQKMCVSWSIPVFCFMF